MEEGWNEQERLAFGDRLKQAREAKGLTQTQAGVALDLGKGAVSAWETGKNLPSAEMVARLATEYDVDAGWLLLGIRAVRQPAAQAAQPIMQIVGAPGDPMGMADAFERVGIALAAAPRGMREAIAQNLAGWAREGGADHYRVAIVAMLSSDGGDRRA